MTNARKLPLWRLSLCSRPPSRPPPLPRRTLLRPRSFKNAAGPCLRAAAVPEHDRVRQSRSRLPPVPGRSQWAAVLQLLLFDRATDDFAGTVHMIRADLYHGQPCPKTGGSYVFNPANGYYRCGL